MHEKFIYLGTILLFLLSACQSAAPTESTYAYVVEDNTERTYQVRRPMTVEEFLQEAQIAWDENDRIVPPLYTQVTSGTRITIVRVDEDEECQLEEIPFQDERIPNQGFEAGEERVVTQGQNGQQRVCYRLISENGIQTQRIPVGQPEIIQEPQNRVVIYGIARVVEPIPIVGSLAYLNNGNAWVMQRSSTENRALTLTSDLDSLVFSLSSDGRYLLFTRDADEDAFVNELWAVEVSQPQNLAQFSITDVLHAEWLPSEDYSISYSTSEAQEVFPFWRAFNNVWVSRIEPSTGDILNARLLVDESTGGAYGWWGTVLSWSPDGETLAWARADSMGVYNSDNEPVPLTNYASFRNLQEWSWRSNLSWSWDGELIATVIHGPTAANTPADSSPIFSVVVLDRDGNFEAMIAEGSGMWAQPQFSPQLNTPDNVYPSGYLAYLKSRDANNSVFGEYDLVVADRDGSNARVIFPKGQGQAGITWQDNFFRLTPRLFTWSPDGRQIAVIYQGDLYIVDVASEASYRMTFDGQSENPVWSP